jgi:hypothetical protein
MALWLETHRTLSLLAAGGSAALALYLFWRGHTLLFWGLRHPAHPDQSTRVVQGFRRSIVAIGLLFLAGGFFWAAAWPFIFAAVFLGEELFETGIMLAALHDRRKEDERLARAATKKTVA